MLKDRGVVDGENHLYTRLFPTSVLLWCTCFVADVQIKLTFISMYTGVTALMQPGIKCLASRHFSSRSLGKVEHFSRSSSFWFFTAFCLIVKASHCSGLFALFSLIYFAVQAPAETYLFDSEWFLFSLHYHQVTLNLQKDAGPAVLKVESRCFWWVTSVVFWGLNVRMSKCFGHFSRTMNEAVSLSQTHWFC